MMRIITIFISALILTHLLILNASSQIIVDHWAVQEFEQIPDEWIEKAKELTIHYGHTSHGSQILAGLYWIEDNIPGTPVNIMDQYHPDSFTKKGTSQYNPRYEDISRHPTREEIQQVFDYARDIGINFVGATFDR